MPLCLQVAGCVKNLAVVGYGVAVHAEHVAFTQLAGYAVSILGFAMYSRLKMTSSVVPKSDALPVVRKTQ